MSQTVDCIRRGDVLYTECKDVFLDLQKQKNQNNALVHKMMLEM